MIPGMSIIVSLALLSVGILGTYNFKCSECLI